MFFNTFVFQAGLVNLLFHKFKGTILLSAAYLALSISFHIWVMVGWGGRRGWHPLLPSSQERKTVNRAGKEPPPPDLIPPGRDLLEKPLSPVETSSSSSVLAHGSLRWGNPWFKSVAAAPGLTGIKPQQTPVLGAWGQPGSTEGWRGSWLSPPD